MLTKLTDVLGVSFGVRFFAPVFAAMAVLSLSGCGAGTAMKEQFRRDTFQPTSATVDGVSIHVYLDRSGSMKHLRPQVSDQLLELLDLYPDSARTTVYWYAQSVSKIKTTFCSRPLMQEITQEFITDEHAEPPKNKGTALALALRDLQDQCAREIDRKVIGIFVTDGGFEDQDGKVATEAQRLRDIPNAAMLVFVGLDAQGTTKLSNLDAVVKDNFVLSGVEVDKKFFDVALKGGGPMLGQAKGAIQTMITDAKEIEGVQK